MGGKMLKVSLAHRLLWRELKKCKPRLGVGGNLTILDWEL